MSRRTVQPDPNGGAVYVVDDRDRKVVTVAYHQSANDAGAREASRFRALACAETVRDALDAGRDVPGWRILHENAGGGLSIEDADGKYACHTSQAYGGQPRALVYTSAEAVATAEALTAGRRA